MRHHTGEMMIGVFTKDIQFEEQDEKITVHVNYALDINGDPVADCNIDIKNNALDDKFQCCFKYSLLLFVS